MLGFEYIKNWESIFHPFLTTLFGVISYLSILAIGRIEIKLLKIKISRIWDLSARIILGVFTLSLLNQVLAYLKINTYQTYIFLIAIFTIISFWEILNIELKKFKLIKKDMIPLSFLSIIFFVRYTLSIIPSSKIDELNYHMFTPLRIVSDEALIYYQFPWPASIWPHMHYQILGAPFYSIGYPDSLNLLSLAIFSAFIYTVYLLIKENTNNSNLGLWAGVIVATGLHSTVDITTNSSNALLLLGSSLSLIVLCDSSRFMPSKDLRSFSFYFGLLFLATISSKVSMLPISFLMIFLFIKVVCDYWSSKVLLRAFSYFITPLLIFYLPLLIYTWIESGSPFGAFLNSTFTGQEPIYDPYLEFRDGKMGYRGNFKEISFFLLTKWSPLIWISWIFLPLKRINLRSKLIISSIFMIQFFVIWALLPNRPRHFGGLQYVALVMIFIEIIPIIYSKFRNFLISLFLLSSIPWIFLDIYYALPLVSKAITRPEKFKNDYIPFFSDFKKIDQLIEKNAQLFVIGTRLNNFHAPRKVFLNKIDVKERNLPTYLFLVGEKNLNSLKDFNLENKIYENIYAKKFCYRTPGKKCDTDKLSVYKINFND